MTNEKISEIAQRYAGNSGIPAASVHEFARAIEVFVREDQLKVATMARYKAHRKKDRCGLCGRPFWHYIERQGYDDCVALLRARNVD